ncbi:porin [Burkholderia sp. Bp9143]|uniref:porin n=1 Tax=Burkholderia sp. Bp9143 TaxID=2184574 RepID=UPI000F596755|nr:porin [Burkholderia sp. Bp9143]RQR25115.1 porin [Burkholderia sp. Bp9143]
MKKSILAITSFCVFGASVHAQSSVSLYGIVDAGILYVNNQGHRSLLQAASGNQQGPRWGFKMVEDLGGGLSVISQLENGFNIMNGALSQGGREFGRQAWVGLSSKRFGMLSMGRQYNPMQDFLAPLQIAASTNIAGFGAHPLDNDNLNNTFRTDNSIKYATRVYSGFQAEAMYAFSNSTNFSRNRSYSLGASFTGGNVQFAAGYVRLDAAAFKGDSNGAIPADNFYNSSAAAALATAASVQQWGGGGTYVLGPATLGLMYTRTVFKRPMTGSLFSGATGNGGGTGSLGFQNIEGSVRYSFTPFLLGVVAQAYTHATQGSSSGNYWQTSAGVHYFLSKRTNFYADAFYQFASNRLNAWIPFTGAPSSTRSQIAAVAGIRQLF